MEIAESYEIVKKFLAASSCFQKKFKSFMRMICSYWGILES